MLSAAQARQAQGCLSACAGVRVGRVSRGLFGPQQDRPCSRHAGEAQTGGRHRKCSCLTLLARFRLGPTGVRSGEFDGCTRGSLGLGEAQQREHTKQIERVLQNVSVVQDFGGRPA